MKQIYIIGIGPGSYEDMTIRAVNKLKECTTIVGYQVYTDLLKPYFPEKNYLFTPMTKEVDRCHLCYQEAQKGKTVAMVCSGDAGVYGMAGLMIELNDIYPDVTIEVIPGVTAALSGAAILGAPLIQDFALISLSNLLTPMELIEKRILACASADMVLCLYNPSSKKRADFLKKACDLILTCASPDTPCGIVENIGRVGETDQIYTLKQLRDVPVNMFTTVFIGNSHTKIINGKLATDRGYLKKTDDVRYGSFLPYRNQTT